MYESTQKIIKHKVGLLNLAEELGNVSNACQIMGLSRDTFYRYWDAVEDGAVVVFFEKNRREELPQLSRGSRVPANHASNQPVDRERALRLGFGIGPAGRDRL